MSPAQTAFCLACLTVVAGTLMPKQAAARDTRLSAAQDAAGISMLKLPYAMKALFIILSSDGAPPACTTKQLAQYLFNDVPAPAALTLQSMMRDCSHGQTWVNQGTSRVVEVKIPRSVTTKTYAFQWQQCRSSDVKGMAAYVDEHLAASGTDVRTFTHRVLVLPPSSPCPFIGFSDIACVASGRCHTWVHGRFWNQVPNYFHELGHSLGINHAAAGTNPYADMSSAMGTCCLPRCFNAVQNWQLGWEKPAAVINKSCLAPGAWRSWHVPAPTSGNSSAFLLIDPDWMDAAEMPDAAAVPGATSSDTHAALPSKDWTSPQLARSLRSMLSASKVQLSPAAEKGAAKPGRPLFFVSYRPAVGLDAHLPVGVRDNVLIHRFQGGDRGNPLVNSELLSALAPRQAWADGAPVKAAGEATSASSQQDPGSPIQDGFMPALKSGEAWADFESAAPGPAPQARTSTAMTGSSRWAAMRVRSDSKGAWVALCRWVVDRNKECPLPAGVGYIPVITA